MVSFGFVPKLVRIISKLDFSWSRGFALKIMHTFSVLSYIDELVFYVCVGYELVNTAMLYVFEHS